MGLVKQYPPTPENERLEPNNHPIEMEHHLPFTSKLWVGKSRKITQKEPTIGIYGTVCMGSDLFSIMAVLGIYWIYPPPSNSHK